MNSGEIYIDNLSHRTSGTEKSGLTHYRLELVDLQPTDGATGYSGRQKLRWAESKRLFC